MIPLQAYENKTIGVFGLGRSGLAAVRALAAGGANVLAWDDNAGTVEGFEYPTSDLYQADLSQLSALVVAPGVPLSHPSPHPLVVAARDARVPVVGDIELFAAARAGLGAHRVAAITGTNGKSTTTALLGHVLEAASVPVAVGGNIGIPVFDLEPLGEGGVYVLELSSFQLDLTHTLKADLAILLNITPDHLDRHGTMESYVRSKLRLFEMQTPDQVAVISVDDPESRKIASKLKQTVIPVSVEAPQKGGVYVQDGRLFDSLKGPAKEVGSLLNCRSLHGRHNWQNAAAVYAAGRLLGVSGELILDALHSFPGLNHRLQCVSSAAGVLFVNDSKASNVDAALKALQSFEDIYWIAGGRLKAESLSPLDEGLGRVRKAYLIGEAADIFELHLKDRLPTEILGEVQAAVEAAARDAAAAGGGVVLLAPACASFDQFRNFEERGDAFTAAVERAVARLNERGGI